MKQEMLKAVQEMNKKEIDLKKEMMEVVRNMNNNDIPDKKNENSRFL